MIRTATALCLLSLGACAPQLSLLPPSHGGTSPPPAPPQPVCPGSMTADLLQRPPLPPGAGFPAPTDQASSEATGLYLTWLHDFSTWAKTGWARAADAKAFCQTKPK